MQQTHFTYFLCEGINFVLTFIINKMNVLTDERRMIHFENMIIRSTVDVVLRLTEYLQTQKLIFRLTFLI